LSPQSSPILQPLLFPNLSHHQHLPQTHPEYPTPNKP
jgi:hypothetical protein